MTGSKNTAVPPEITTANQKDVRSWSDRRIGPLLLRWGHSLQNLLKSLEAHPFTYQGKDGYYFAVWAPHAVSVSVVGDFNGWNPDLNPMMPVKDSGIYEAFVPGLASGQLYKYAITTGSGKILFKRILCFHTRIQAEGPCL